jgi:hypothetical protein
VAGPRRLFTGFPVQPNGFLSVDLSPAASNEAAFNPREKNDGTCGRNKVNLPRVTKRDAARVTTSGKRIAQEILTSRVQEVVGPKAQA